MLRTMLKSKIHRATVTSADLQFVGSVTVDAELLEAADLLEGEQVTIVDVTNGARLRTHVTAGERGSGVLGIHGALAHQVARGDRVILLAYGVMDEQEARSYRPRVVFVDDGNAIAAHGSDAGGRLDPAIGLDVALAEGDAASAETDDAAKLDALLQPPEA